MFCLAWLVIESVHIHLDIVDWWMNGTHAFLPQYWQVAFLATSFVVIVIVALCHLPCTSHRLTMRHSDTHTPQMGWFSATFHTNIGCPRFANSNQRYILVNFNLCLIGIIRRPSWMHFGVSESTTGWLVANVADHNVVDCFRVLCDVWEWGDGPKMVSLGSEKSGSFNRLDVLNRRKRARI